MKKEIIILLTIIGILAIIVVSIYYGGTAESILSQSSVTLDNGKVYWLLQGSANSYSPEIYTFSPSKYKYTDGSETTVTPKESLVLAVSKLDTECVYLTNLVTKSYNLGISKFYYYTLTNPQKIANVQFTDGNEKSITIDGTVVQTGYLSDSDGTGKIEITTQGLLGGKYSCPNYDNTALYIAKDGSYGFFYRDDIDSLVNGWWDVGTPGDLTIDDFKKLNYLSYNTGFTNTFSALQFSKTAGKVTGAIPIGNVVFTVKADQDYFNSITYTPSKSADPDVTGINIPSEITKDASSSMVVNIKNKASNSGNIVVTPSSNIFTFSPSTTNVNLPGSGTTSITFNVKASNSIQCSDIKVEACSQGEFTASQNCDSYSKNVCIISDTTPEEGYCGDNICQSSESELTCPADCKIGGGEQIECKWYQDYSSSNSWLFGSGQTCRLSLWIVVVSFIIIILLIVGGIIFVKRKLA